MAEIRLTQAAAIQLERLNEPIHTRILHLLERLQNWPNVSGAKPLRGDLSGMWRMRTGDYRIIFRVTNDAAFVIVEQIGHRRDIYEE